MTAEWYYAKNKQKVGPITTAQLKELARTGQLTPTDMVWKNGMAKWTPAGQVQGLFDTQPQLVRSPAPPPLPDDEAGPVVAPSSMGIEMPWPAHERTTGFTISQWIGFGAAGIFGLVGFASIIDALIHDGRGLCCGPMLFCLTALVIWLVVFNGWMMHGRWVPVDGTGGWLELFRGGHFKREDGTIGTFVMSRNKKFIDFFVGNKLVDSWRVLSWGVFAGTLEVQDMSGKGRSFSKGETLKETAEVEMGGKDRQEQPKKPVASPAKSSVTSEGGISNPAVAKQVTEKKAAAKFHAKQVEFKTLSEPTHTVFSGDAPCPKCKTMIWVEWQNVTVAMACPKCGFRFDHNMATAFLSAHKPEDNFKPDEAKAAVEVVDVLERAKALLARHEAESEIADGEIGVEPDPISTICHHCLAKYRARIRAGATTRCETCLEDFVVYSHIPNGKDFLIESIKGLNPLSWFAKEKCPQCRGAALHLGDTRRDNGFVLADGKMIPKQVSQPYYVCHNCRVTWEG